MVWLLGNKRTLKVPFEERKYLNKENSPVVWDDSFNLYFTLKRRHKNSLEKL